MKNQHFGVFVQALDRKLIIREPKSGRELEVVFIPHKLAGRIKDYIREKGI